MIKIFCDKKEKEIKNFWSHAVYHPTNAIEDDWGRQHLDKIADDKALNTIRVYSMFEESVSRDENGEMQFDWSKNDLRFDYLVGKGFNLVVSYAFIPTWLAAEQDPDLVKPRYKDVTFYRSYPSDYKKWGEICRVYTRHLIERYGEDTVAKWWLNCYNEPDLGHFFYLNAGDDYVARAAEYCKLYDAFEEGITSVSRKLRIGACSLSESTTHLPFLEEFLKHVKQSGRKFDFLSFHSYGSSAIGLDTKLRPLDSRDSVKNTYSVRAIAEMCGFKGIPLLCDEWGGSTSGYRGIERTPELIFRENEIFAAYFVKLLTYYDESGLDPEMIMLCLSGQHDLPGDFLGHRNFFTKSFYPKPIYNAFVLASKLGNEKLYHYTTLSFQPEDYISVMPTKHKDGHMSHLLAYADHAFRIDLPIVDFTISFEGLDREYKVVKYVIDKTHANCYTKFCELGKPQDASDEIQEEIRSAGKLYVEDSGFVSPENHELSLHAENNSVILLELFPTQ